MQRISIGINNLVDGIKTKICVADDDENFLDIPDRVEECIQNLFLHLKKWKKK